MHYHHMLLDVLSLAAMILIPAVFISTLAALMFMGISNLPAFFYAISELDEVLKPDNVDEESLRLLLSERTYVLENYYAKRWHEHGAQIDFIHNGIRVVYFADKGTFGIMDVDESWRYYTLPSSIWNSLISPLDLWINKKYADVALDATPEFVIERLDEERQRAEA